MLLKELVCNRAFAAKKKQEREEKRKQTMAANTAAPGPAVVDMTNSDEEGAAPATTSPAKAPALKQATLNFQKPTGSA